jgi:hypothetical protein
VRFIALSSKSGIKTATPKEAASFDGADRQGRRQSQSAADAGPSAEAWFSWLTGAMWGRCISRARRIGESAARFREALPPAGFLRSGDFCGEPILAMFDALAHFDTSGGARICFWRMKRRPLARSFRTEITVREIFAAV